MSKYTPEELKRMADTLLEAKHTDAVRYLEFIMTVSMKANVDPRFVERKILEYSNKVI